MASELSFVEFVVDQFLGPAFRTVFLEVHPMIGISGRVLIGNSEKVSTSDGRFRPGNT
jgi:hypothetical protein